MFYCFKILLQSTFWMFWFFILFLLWINILIAWIYLCMAWAAWLLITRYIFVQSMLIIRFPTVQKLCQFAVLVVDASTFYLFTLPSISFVHDIISGFNYLLKYIFDLFIMVVHSLLHCEVYVPCLTWAFYFIA